MGNIECAHQFVKGKCKRVDLLTEMEESKLVVREFKAKFKVASQIGSRREQENLLRQMKLADEIWQQKNDDFFGLDTSKCKNCPISRLQT